MSASQSQTFSSEKEMLDTLAESLIQPERFAQVDYKVSRRSHTSYVFLEPMKSARKNISFDDVTYVDDAGIIIRLNDPRQIYLLTKGSKKFGMDLRQLSLQETVAAAYLPEAADFKRNVLVRYWIYNGEIIRRFNGRYDVSHAIGAEFAESKVQSKLTLSRKGRLLDLEGQTKGLSLNIKMGQPLQSAIPTRTGYYSQFRGAIPLDAELGPKDDLSKGYFGNNFFDSNGLSVVRSGWGSDDGVLYALADWPLDRDFILALDSLGVLGVCTDENPKK